MNKIYARYLTDEAFRNTLQAAAREERRKAIRGFVDGLLKQHERRPSRMLRRHTAFG